MVDLHRRPVARAVLSKTGENNGQVFIVPYLPFTIRLMVLVDRCKAISRASNHACRSCRISHCAAESALPASKQWVRSCIVPYLRYDSADGTVVETGPAISESK
jgi:hypothetical protein